LTRFRGHLNKREIHDAKKPQTVSRRDEESIQSMLSGVMPIESVQVAKIACVQTAAQLLSAVVAARLRPGGRAASRISNVAGGTPADITLALPSAARTLQPSRRSGFGTRPWPRN